MLVKLNERKMIIKCAYRKLTNIGKNIEYKREVKSKLCL